MSNSITTEEFNQWRKLLLTYKFALKEINTKLNIINEEFTSIHSSNPIEHIKSRVKEISSIMEKLKRKGYEPSIENAKRYIKDIAGIRVICSFTTDIYTLYDLIKQQDDIEVVKIKDYIKNPKSNGYQSLHMLIKIPVFLTETTKKVSVEIQIRTIAMDFWASLEHKIYYKYQKGVPNGVGEQLKECAKLINDLDRRMLEIRKNTMLEVDVS